MKKRKTAPRKKLKATASRARRGSIEEDLYDSEPSMKLSRAFLVVLVLHIVAVGGIFLFNSIQVNQGELGRSFFRQASGAENAGLLNGARKAGSRKEPLIYHLKQGETVEQVAAAYGVPVDDLRTASGLRPNEIARPGQELRIPRKSSLKSPPLDIAKLTKAPRKPLQKSTIETPKPTLPVKRPAAASENKAKTMESPKSPVSPASSTEVYVVVKGDNPVAIARKFGVDYQELLTLNRIEDPRLLQIGTRLRIPAKKTTAN